MNISFQELWQRKRSNNSENNKQTEEMERKVLSHKSEASSRTMTTTTFSSSIWKKMTWKHESLVEQRQSEYTHTHTHWVALISYARRIKHTWFHSKYEKNQAEKNRKEDCVYILSFIYHKMSKKMLLFIVALVLKIRCLVCAHHNHSVVGIFFSFAGDEKIQCSYLGQQKYRVSSKSE